MRFLSPQRMIQIKQGTVDAKGNCIISFDPPPMGYAATGTVTVTTSPPGVIWTVNLGISSTASQDITTILGANPMADIQAFHNETISLNASGLSPGGVFQATWLGVVQDAASTPITYPGAATQQVINSGNQRIAIPLQNLQNNFNYTVNLQPTERSIVIILSQLTASVATTATITVTGQTTGSVSPEVISPVNTSPQTFFSPMQAFGSADSAFTVNVTLAAGSLTGGKIIILAFPDDMTQGDINSPLYVAFPFAQSVQVLGGMAGSGVAGIPHNPIVVSVTTSANFNVVSANATANAQTTLLNTPPAGQAWALHSWASFDIANQTSGSATIFDGSTNFYGDLHSGQNGQQLLAGLETTLGVAVFNGCPANCRVTLFYSQVTL